MKIVIIGAGKVGITLAQRLAKEDHQVTLVDTRAEALEEVSALDVLAVE